MCRSFLPYHIQVSFPSLLPGKTLDNARFPLSGHRHKGPFIGVCGFFQYIHTESPIIYMPLSMRAGSGFPIRSADGAHLLFYCTADAHLLLNAAFQSQDQSVIFPSSGEVRPGHKAGVRLPSLCLPAGNGLHPAVEDPGRLSPGVGRMVEDPRFSSEKLCQLLKSRYTEAFQIPVRFIVTEHHRKSIELLRAEFSAGVFSDLFHFLRCGYSGFQGILSAFWIFLPRIRRTLCFFRICFFLEYEIPIPNKLFDHAFSSPFKIDFSNCMALALSHRALAFSVSSCRVISSHRILNRREFPSSRSHKPHIFRMAGSRSLL